MLRKIRVSEKILLLGYGLIFIFMVVQDWVPLGTLNNVQAISLNRSKSELVTVTIIGVVQILILIALILVFVGKRQPLWVKFWLIIHPTFIFAGALLDWWIPYLFGYGAEEKSTRYIEMFGNTHSFLPLRNGIVPNTLHILFHTILLICIFLTIYISFTNKSRSSQKKYISREKVI